MNNYIRTFLSILISLICLKAQAMIVEHTKYVATITSLSGSATLLCEDGSEDQLKLGMSIEENCFVSTKEESYLRLMGDDNSLYHLGENVILKIGKLVRNEVHINLISGQLRIFSYKGKKFVKTPWGRARVSNGEYIWNVIRESKTKSRVIISALSGELVLDNGKVVRPKKYEQKPEQILARSESFTKPWLRYFYADEDKTQFFVYRPSFDLAPITNLNTGATRAIASVSDDEIENVFDESFDSVDTYEYPQVNKEIWAHDVLYDSVVKACELRAQKLAQELVPVAVEAAMDRLVWDVAARESLRWAMAYAKKSVKGQIARSINATIIEREIDTKIYNKKELIKESVKRVAKANSFRSAAIAAQKGGYEKGWRSANKYALSLIKEIVLPPIKKKIYDQVKVIAAVEAKKVLDNSELVRDENVDELVEYLSQKSSEKIVSSKIDEFAPAMAEAASKKAALEAAKETSTVVADYISDKVAKHAVVVVERLVDDERAKEVARSISSEAKDQSSRNLQIKSRD